MTHDSRGCSKHHSKVLLLPSKLHLIIEVVICKQFDCRKLLQVTNFKWLVVILTGDGDGDGDVLLLGDGLCSNSKITQRQRQKPTANATGPPLAEPLKS